MDRIVWAALVGVGRSDQGLLLFNDNFHFQAGSLFELPCSIAINKNNRIIVPGIVEDKVNFHCGNSLLFWYGRIVSLFGDNVNPFSINIW
jgi:hypothetical protein